MDTLTTILVAHSMYTYYVLNFGDLEADGFIPWYVIYVSWYYTGRLLPPNFDRSFAVSVLMLRSRRH